VLEAIPKGRIYVMAIISFENIVGDDGSKAVPDGFRKLDWKNFWAIDALSGQNTGFEGRTHVMAIIRFEGIAAVDETLNVPEGYRNLSWSNFSAIGELAIATDINAIHSGEAAGFTFERSAGFQSPDCDDDFDLNNGYFTAYNANDLKVKVFGFDDGERVAKKVLLLDTDREFVRFGSQFDDIDEVRFTTKGGTAADPNDMVGVSSGFGVDDLFIDF